MESTAKAVLLLLLSLANFVQFFRDRLNACRFQTQSLIRSNKYTNIYVFELIGLFAP